MKIETCLSNFDSVSLNDLSSVRLMDRIDTKFVFQKQKILDLFLFPLLDCTFPLKLKKVPTREQKNENKKIWNLWTSENILRACKIKSSKLFLIRITILA